MDPSQPNNNVNVPGGGGAGDQLVGENPSVGNLPTNTDPSQMSAEQFANMGFAPSTQWPQAPNMGGPPGQQTQGGGGVGGLGAVSGQMYAPQTGQMQTQHFNGQQGAFAQPGMGMAAGAPDMKPGDWNCPGCGHLNFARRTNCQRCGGYRPGVGGGYHGGHGGFGDHQAFGGQQWGGRQDRMYGGPSVRPGDWYCSACGAHNFASRGQCFRCGMIKPEGAEHTIAGGYGGGGYQQRGYENFGGRRGGGGFDNYQAPGGYGGGFGGGGYGGGGGGGGSRHDFKPGDWSCTACGAHNFASRSACFRCSMARPQDAASAAMGGPMGGPMGDLGGPPRQMQ
ncbi:UPF0481 protein [Pycnococcus provasolii]